MQGTLLQDRLPDLLQSLGRDRETGILRVSRDDITKRIYFGRGAMVFARSSLQEDRLGELLVRKGELTRSNLALASNRMRARQRKLGVTLVDLGLMNPLQLRTRLEDQARTIIHSLFAWDHGRFRFQSKATDDIAHVELDLPTVPILLEGTRVMGAEAVRRALGDLKRAVSNSKDPRVVPHYANLTPEEGFVLSRVDGTASLADIVSISPIAEDQTLRCIYGLVASGFLEIGKKSREVTPSTKQRSSFDALQAMPALGSTPIANAHVDAPPTATLSPEERGVRDTIVAKQASLASGTLYDWLEVSRTAGAAEIKRAFSRLIKSFHPDRHRATVLLLTSAQLDDIVAKITRAYETLGDVQARRRYDNSLRSEAPRGEAVAAVPKVAPKPKLIDIQEKTADRYYREARRYFGQRDFHATVKLMHDAVELDPQKVRYHCLLARALAQNPKWRQSAEEHFKLALEMDVYDVESLIGLGELYESVGLVQRAQALYSEAKEIEPSSSVLRMKLRNL